MYIWYSIEAFAVYRCSIYVLFIQLNYAGTFIPYFYSLSIIIIKISTFIQTDMTISTRLGNIYTTQQEYILYI